MPMDSTEQMESIQALRNILAKSARTESTNKASSSKSSSRKSSPNDIQQTSPKDTKHSAPATSTTTVPPSKSSSKTPSPTTLVLQIPTVNVPGSSPKAAAPSTSPLKHGSFFKSFRGRSAFDADEDEFDTGRKYSTATLKKDGLGSMPEVPSGTNANSLKSSQQSRGRYGLRPFLAGVLRGGSFFPAPGGRTPFDADDDDLDGRCKESTADFKEKTEEAPKTPLLAATRIVSPRLHSSYPLPSASPSSPSELKSRNFLASFRGRSPFDADDDEFDSSRAYTIDAPKSSLKSSPTTPTANKKPSARRISWADQTNPAPSDTASEQSTLGSKADDGKTGSTLSLTSTLDFAPPTSFPAPPRSLDGHKTIRKSQAKIMSSTLAAARDISPYKGNPWDPDDDEWAEVDAKRVLETFTASYKSPGARSPVKMGALSYFGTAVQNTVKSVLLSPTKKAAQEKLRLDERVQDQIDELRNTYNCDPNGDLNDDVMKHMFIQDPAGRFFGNQSPRTMHIIDLAAYFNTEDPLLEEARPRLCDAVATILSHTNKECLDAFLSPSVKTFTYRREVDNSKGGLILIIHREGNEVICGGYVNFGFMLQWKLYVKSVINITGQWHEMYATTKAGLMRINNGAPEWNVIRSDLPEDKGEEVDPKPVEGLIRKLELSPGKKKISTSDDVNETNPKYMLYQSRILARHLLWDIWYRFDKMYDCRATWEADGEETKMRLKRELVGAGEDE